FMAGLLGPSRDRDELEPFTGDQIDDQNIPNARGVILVLGGVRFEGGGFQSFQTICVRSGSDGDSVGEAGYFCDILSVAKVEFLAIEIAYCGIGFHDDAGLGSVDASLERTVDIKDFVAVELMRVFAEIPDSAPGVLRVPIECILGQDASAIYGIVDFDAVNAEDRFGVMGYENDVAFERIRIDEGGTGDEWHERIIDRADEVGRIDYWLEGRGAQTGAG